MSLGIWDAAGNVPFIGSIKRGIDTTASALGLSGSVNINPESTYSPKAPEPQPSPEWKEQAPDPEPQPENTGGNPLTDWIPGWDKSKGVFENFTGGVADNTVELIPGWDSSKGVTANVTGGIMDVFTNAGKAAAELGSSLTNGVKKYAPLALAGGLAILLLRK